MQPQESTVHQLVGVPDLASQGEVRLELNNQLAHGGLNQQVRPTAARWQAAEHSFNRMWEALVSHGDGQGLHHDPVGPLRGD